MPRKKVSADENSLPEVDLDDDEQLVIENTNTKTVRRERVTPQPAAEQAKPADVPPAIDIDDDADDDEEPFSDSSLAGVIFGEPSSENIENQFCTVHVRRNPDSMGDTFASACGDVTSLPRIGNVPLSTDKADIEDRVRRDYGGGHYYFQIHYAGQLGRSWRATLADLPEHLRNGGRGVAGDTQPAAVFVQPPLPATPPVDPVTQFLDGLEKQKRMKELLFGEDRERMERELAELRAENERSRQQPMEPKGERLVLLETALAATSPELQTRLLEHLFPTDEPGGKRHWFADLADVALQNKDTILGLLGGLLGMAPPTPPQTIDDMMRATPPMPPIPPLPPMPPVPSSFGRKPVTAPPSEISNSKSEIPEADAEAIGDDQLPADAPTNAPAAIDADTSDEKPKARAKTK